MTAITSVDLMMNNMEQGTTISSKSEGSISGRGAIDVSVHVDKIHATSRSQRLFSVSLCAVAATVGAIAIVLLVLGGIDYGAFENYDSRLTGRNLLISGGVLGEAALICTGLCIIQICCKEEENVSYKQY